MSELGETGSKDLEGDGHGLVTLGRVTGAHGLKGWVKVHSDTDPRENIAGFSHLLLSRGDGWERWKVNAGGRQGKNVVLKLKGCNDRDTAEALVGSQLAIERDRLPALEHPEEFYWTDLQGLLVETQAGLSLGRLDHLFETGANDVMVVRGDRERLIPFVWDQVVKAVDFEEGVVRVDWDPEF